MNIPDIIYAYHEDLIGAEEARFLIDALARKELNVSLDDEDEAAQDASLEVDVSYGRSPEEMRQLVAIHDARRANTR